jgi:hypothetical protein
MGSVWSFLNATLRMGSQLFFIQCLIHKIFLIVADHDLVVKNAGVWTSMPILVSLTRTGYFSDW